jgi:hypothetical protein
MKPQKLDLDTPILTFGPENSELSVRACCEGILITGGIGSGKTTGSYSFILRRFLKFGMGGLLLIVKPQEAEEYRKLCIETGREKDLIVIEPGCEHSFNWLEYESSVTEDNRPITDNILEVLKTCIKAGAEKDISGSDDGFWQQSLDALIGHVIDLCILAYDKVSIENIYHIVQSLPKLGALTGSDTIEETAFDKAWKFAVNKTNAKRHKWHTSLCDEERNAKLPRADFEAKLYDAVPETRLLDFLTEFFFDSFKNLSPKTRAIIEFTFSSFLYSLLREPVYSLFAKKSSTVTPEDIFSGKILLINLPVKKYHATGKNVQLIVKYVTQRAMERRLITDATMPVFLASDEAYTFVHEHDTLFQATARSSRICTLAVTQNLGNYYAAMGGEKAKYRVSSLISTLATKFFHANTDRDSNVFAAELVGEDYFEDPSVNLSMSPESFSHGQNTGRKLEKILRPEFFVSLRCGGPKNDFIVQCVIHKQGDPFANGANHALIHFKQKQINQ